MTGHQEVIDRFEIVTLQNEYTDAAMVRDNARMVELFTDDGVYQIPDAKFDVRGREQLRAGTDRLEGAWEFFLQTTHPGQITIDGDTASGRAYITERGRLNDGRSMFNHGLFHDQYRRTPEGWRFSERVFEIRYIDITPLAGSTRVDFDFSDGSATGGAPG